MHAPQNDALRHHPKREIGFDNIDVAAGNAGVRAGRWVRPERPVNRIAGRTLALIGFGAIGRRVAARAQAFGIRTVAYDPYADDAAVGETSRAERVEDPAAEADFVSIHAPLTPETRHLIDHDVLAAAQRSPILVNTARGGLVDLDAVVWALGEGKLDRAALDVTEPEPLPADHPLLADERVILTPHTAFFSAESEIELQCRAAEEVARALRGKATQNPRNPEVDTAGKESG